MSENEGLESAIKDWNDRKKYSESNMQSDRGYRSIASTLHMNCTNGNLPIDFNFYASYLENK